MKKKITIGVGVFTALLISLYFYVPVYITKMVTDYEPYTFEKVFNDSYLKNTQYGIGENTSPADYGFAFEDVKFQSAKDKLPLSAWFMPANSDTEIKRCIILVHGRTSNRLKPMKYLKLFQEAGLDSTYHVFLPDMRNSGLSPSAQTAMGYYFAEDLLGSLQWLATEKGIEEVVIYAFSMGAMATNTLLVRTDLANPLQQTGIAIKGIILDSPLSNVERTLQRSSQEMGLPDFVFKSAMDHFNNRFLSAYLPQMRLSAGLANLAVPMLLLQSKEDQTTPWYILEDEWQQMKENDLIQLVLFETGGHVKMYITPEENSQYENRIRDFFQQLNELN
jgi:uncharacterized protein